MQNECGGDYTKCKSAKEFVDGNTRLFHQFGEACQARFEKEARYEVKWAHYGNFTSYLLDQQGELAQCEFKLVDGDVKMQNGFGSFAAGRAVYKVDLKTNEIIYIKFYQR
jgi:hypothetical protein